MVLGPATKNEMMKSSKLNVKLNRKPARIAGDNWGKVICTNVRHGDAYKSSEASIRARSMPAILARTRTITSDMVNSVWAAMTDT